jgi:hypothetical protein
METTCERAEEEPTESHAPEHAVDDAHLDMVELAEEEPEEPFPDLSFPNVVLEWQFESSLSDNGKSLKLGAVCIARHRELLDGEYINPVFIRRSIRRFFADRPDALVFVDLVPVNGLLPFHLPECSIPLSSLCEFFSGHGYPYLFQVIIEAIFEDGPPQQEFSGFFSFQAAPEKGELKMPQQDAERQ